MKIALKLKKKNDNCFNTNELKKIRMQFIMIYHDKKFQEIEFYKNIVNKPPYPYVHYTI